MTPKRSERGAIPAAMLPFLLAGVLSSVCAKPLVEDLAYLEAPHEALTYRFPSAEGEERHVIVISVSEIIRLARHAANEVGVDPALVQAVLANESAYDPNAVSKTGAKGLMQLSSDAASDCGLVADRVFDPEHNVTCGADLLASLVRRFPGHIGFAIAAYNSGPLTVERFGGIPPYAETQRYVTDVLSTYRRYLAER